MRLSITSRGVPIVSARQVAPMLSPNGDGTWSVAIQTTALHSAPFWNIIQVPSGASVSALPVGGANNTNAGSNNQGGHVGLNIANQLRDKNGLIWVPCSKANLHYFDPADKLVHAMPQLTDGAYSPEHENTGFTHIFGQDNNLYIGCQTDSTTPWKPAIIQVNVDTKVRTILTHGGFFRSSGPTYAYDMRADMSIGGARWLYVVIGKSPWELIGINIDTLEVRSLLGPIPGNGPLGALSSMKIVTSLGAGVGAVIQVDHDLGKSDNNQLLYWAVDGAVSTYVAGDPGNTFVHRDTTSPSWPVAAPIQTDITKGAGRLLWRANGSSGAYTTIDYTVNNTQPTTLESLCSLTDGTVLTSGEQYNGFDRWDPVALAHTWYGALLQGGAGNTGISKPTVLQHSNGLVYWCGYPDNKFYSYDPTQPWANGVNPIQHSNASLSGAKYCYGLRATTARIFTCGRREREGVGGGVGIFDIASNTWIAGTHLNLNFCTPRGHALFESLGRYVLSGMINLDPLFPGGEPTTQQLIIFDTTPSGSTITELERQTPNAAWTDTGTLYRSPSEASVVVGISGTHQVAYRWDIVSKVLLKTVDLSSYGAIGTSTQNVGGNITIVMGTALYMIDVLTLTVRLLDGSGQLAATITALGGGPTHIAWTGAPGDAIGGESGGDDGDG